MLLSKLSATADQRKEGRNAVGRYDGILHTDIIARKIGKRRSCLLLHANPHAKVGLTSFENLQQLRAAYDSDPDCTPTAHSSRFVWLRWTEIGSIEHGNQHLHTTSLMNACASRIGANDVGHGLVVIVDVAVASSQLTLAAMRLTLTFTTISCVQSCVRRA